MLDAAPSGLPVFDHQAALLRVLILNSCSANAIAACWHQLDQVGAKYQGNQCKYASERPARYY